jgi:hypothetical protein
VDLSAYQGDEIKLQYQTQFDKLTSANLES